MCGNWLTNLNEFDNILKASEPHGEMSEWLKEPVLKTGDVKASVGSNPTLSAKFILICRSTQEAEGAPLLRE